MSGKNSKKTEPDQALALLALKKELSDRTKELQEAREQSARDMRLAALGQLVSTAAHELRGPLGAMLTSVHLLESRVDTTDTTVKRGLERIRRSVRRCDDIITRLLDYSRYEALTLEPTRIDQWLRALLHTLNLPEGVSLAFDPGLGDRRIAVDRDKLHQAVVSVIDNAARAIVDSGIPGQVSVSTHARDRYFAIRVADSGPGIPEEHREAVFEPFFSTRRSGVGLGLAIAKRFIEQHGGTISFVSRPKRETCFTITLPAITGDVPAD